MGDQQSFSEAPIQCLASYMYKHFSTTALNIEALTGFYQQFRITVATLGNFRYE